MSTGKRTRLAAADRRERIEVAATQVFAERGYTAASMAEIAARSGVTVPVVYDHFASKLDLHRRLLERTRNELLELWREHLFGDEAAEVRIPRAIEAWAAYVETHPYAARMFFRGVAGDAEADAVHREVQGQARVALGVVLAREPGIEGVAGAADQETLEMVAEVMRSGLAGLAMWWSEHPHVPRERVVRAAVAVLWTGFAQARSLERGAGELDERPVD